ncbi:hypothetical protein KUTeg_016894 [Tegillarca granosa]|uniref:Uncharacterized protein n=1 Tax=Tegillarca granosa TaxID=220873 RepID=A0ABQ9EM56_TEGGR|nr:hypothetical protein KUTeg_016894 [Tegillarca granosa]
MFQAQNKDSQTFWSSTGLFPQEFVITFTSLMRMTRIELSCFNVKKLVIEKCTLSEPTEFEYLLDKGKYLDKEKYSIEYLVDKEKYSIEYLVDKEKYPVLICCRQRKTKKSIQFEYLVDKEKYSIEYLVNKEKYSIKYLVDKEKQRKVFEYLVDNEKYSIEYLVNKEKYSIEYLVTKISIQVAMDNVLTVAVGYSSDNFMEDAFSFFHGEGIFREIFTSVAIFHEIVTAVAQAMELDCTQEGQLQQEDFTVNGTEAMHLRFVIESGYDHFVSVHKLMVEANAVHG